MSLATPVSGSAALAFENTFAQALPGLGMAWQGAAVPKPTLVKFNAPLAHELGLDVQALDGDEGAAILAGSITPTGATPIAMAYSGHQFGGFSPRLGDGRAITSQLQQVLDRFVVSEPGKGVRLVHLADIPADPSVRQAVMRRQLLMQSMPGSPAALAVTQLAAKIEETVIPKAA